MNSIINYAGSSISSEHHVVAELKRTNLRITISDVARIYEMKQLNDLVG